VPTSSSSRGSRRACSPPRSRRSPQPEARGCRRAWSARQRHEKEAPQRRRLPLFPTYVSFSAHGGATLARGCHLPLLLVLLRVVKGLAVLQGKSGQEPDDAADEDVRADRKGGL